MNSNTELHPQTSLFPMTCIYLCAILLFHSHCLYYSSFILCSPLSRFAGFIMCLTDELLWHFVCFEVLSLSILLRALCQDLLCCPDMFPKVHSCSHDQRQFISFYGHIVSNYVNLSQFIYSLFCQCDLNQNNFWRGMSFFFCLSFPILTNIASVFSRVHVQAVHELFVSYLYWAYG